MENTFCKSERLCNQILFDELMTSDFRFIKYPLRVIAKKSSQKGEFPARIAFSVSKHKFKRAVKRNRIKRQLREAYRTRKHSLYESIGSNDTLDILVVYLDEQLSESARIEKVMQQAIDKIIAHYKEPIHEK